MRVKERIFLTASYGVGGVLLDLKPNTAEPLWADTETLSSQYATPIESDGLLYGFHGRDDVPPRNCAASIHSPCSSSSACYGRCQTLVTAH